MLKLNLQMFSSDDEDMILPDDFDETYGSTPTDEVETNEEGNETMEAEPGAQEEAPSTEQQEEPFLLAKYNKEDKPLTREEAQRLAQIGMHYENKVKGEYENLQSDPRLAFVDQLSKENGYDNVGDFLEAFKTQQEQAKLDELIQNNIPEEYARKMIEFDKLNERITEQDKQRQQEAQEKEQYAAFFDVFKQMNGRDFNPDSDQIPQEVFEIANNGVPLKYAYLEFQSKQMLQQQQVYKQNQTNKGRSPVNSTTNHGATNNEPKDPFLEGFDSYEY